MSEGKVVLDRREEGIAFVTINNPDRRNAIDMEKLEMETLAFARKIASGPPIAIGLTKRILNATFLNMVEGLLEHEALGQALCFQTKDHKEGRDAFFEKREPRFVGE
jgi:2-(1,2-epoxy-1,2-dihydrophenyl)acetyl-CoA isomerase